MPSRMDPQLRLGIEEIVDRKIRGIAGTRDDFQELGRLVADLANAQQRTEKRLDELAKTVGELAQAQARTEKRMDELAKTVGELAQAQARTEKRMDELAQAQTRTEKEIKSLASTVKRIQVEVGGLIHTVGFTLEDRAMRSLPALLRRDHGIDVEGRLVRRFVDCGDGKYVEVNVLGRGQRNGRSVLVVGEAKSQPSRKDVNLLASSAQEIHRLLGEEEVFVILIAYSVHPVVQEVAMSKGIAVYFSYQFD